MTYENMAPAVFLARPNRFLARCQMGGEEILCHVKNTGRCRELLVPGAGVYVLHHDNPARKTAWSLIAVQKGDRLINMDSQAPNQVAYEALRDGLLDDLLGAPARQVRREVTAGDSRLDLTAQAGEKTWYIEVKGVTLEQDGVARFPDAPTVRGKKHLEELMRLHGQGAGAMVLFVIQMADIRYFTPNSGRDPAFAASLRQAVGAGVTVAAFTCRVTPDSMVLEKPVPVVLEQESGKKEEHPRG